jgi:serine/threonine protein kinase
LVTADGTPVISDFGLAFIIDQTEFTSAKIAGSARWSPPEVLDPPDDDEDGEDDGGADRPGSKCKGSDGDDLAVPPYSKKSDVYSMGMAFYEVRTDNPLFMLRRPPFKELNSHAISVPSLTHEQIATGERPFYERRSDSAVIFKIVKGERPDLPALLSDNPIVKDLMARCWEASPTDRPTAAEMCVILEKEFPPAQEEIVGWGLGLGLGAYAQAYVVFPILLHAGGARGETWIDFGIFCLQNRAVGTGWSFLCHWVVGVTIAWVRLHNE